MHTTEDGKVSARLRLDARGLETVTAANFWPWPLTLEPGDTANSHRVTPHVVNLAPATWAAEVIGTVRQRLPQLERFSHTNANEHQLRKDIPVMKLLLTTAFGLLSKFGAFQHAVARSRSDIPIVTETKFTPEKALLSDSSMLDFHLPLRLDRYAQGGGVVVWVRDSLPFDHLSDTNCHGHEFIWLRLHLDNGQKVVVCAVYRPGSCPGQDVSLLEYPDSVMDQARSLGNSVVIAGDLNVHNESWLCSTKTTTAGEYKAELSAFHGLHQHVTQLTRGENTLDLILSDFSETSVEVNVLDPIGASDHATIVATFDATPLREPPTKRRVWRYAQADWGRLRHFYSTANWNISEDPEASCRSVTAVVMEGMNRFIPRKELSTKPTDPSWWTPECSAATQAKNYAWNRLRRHPTCHQQIIDYNAKVRASANCLLSQSRQNLPASEIGSNMGHCETSNGVHS